ncbi:winged helix-turn-helix transcriptional regulator [uncultured Sphingomonas sp.]|uniref:winged helix-turn-helix transcriptional regulator n=1 Tax=uncultured Sphingomonas sp. TaxID=158754 RepID=UPI00374A7FD3
MPTDPSSSSFTSRVLLDQIADKWTTLILGALCRGPLRFNALRRSLDGITQTSLTKTLRRLERNGLLQRTITTDTVIAVEYAITPLGRTLGPLFQALDSWTQDHVAEVESARRRYDGLTD